MHDVARAAGVSQKTVSRVVNGEPHVRADVAARVRAAIDALGFRPNAAARALVTRRSRRIGVISIGSLLYGPATMLAELERAIREAGYAVALIRTPAESESTPGESESTPGETESTRAETESAPAASGGGSAQGSGATPGDAAVSGIQAAIDTLAAEGVDGIVLSEPVDALGGTMVAPPGIPLLTVSPGDHDGPAAIQVGVDQSGGARQATAHLLGLGHRTVAHIAGPQAWAPARQRMRGWRAALHDAGAPEIPPVEGDWSAASGFAAMRELLTRHGHPEPTRQGRPDHSGLTRAGGRDHLRLTHGGGPHPGLTHDGSPDQLRLTHDGSPHPGLTRHSQPAPSDQAGTESHTDNRYHGGITAVFAANDHMAIGAMRAIERAALRVPTDVSVVGFDDIPEAAFLSVALTTVRYDPAEVARNAVRHLIEAIGGATTTRPARTPTHLIVRESSS